jgi:2-amino-4-hydroxy-6-hydroxymethyldihydropteridine diphosphokinase
MIINVQPRASRAQPNKVLMLPSENYMLLALGTNLGDKRANIARALSLIGERIGRVIRVAEPIRTAPVDFTSDHTFLNTVAVVERQPDLSVDDVLRRTQEIERQMGRTLKSHEGIHYDRIMDIDLLMIGETHINRTDLTLPHPRMAERLFVLRPLAEVAPDVIHPEYGMTFKELLAVRERCHFVQLTEAHSPR